MPPRFQVLLHAALWTALRSESRERRQRFARLVERLASRDWSGGTRVKKLRGCGRPVFEARHDAGDRVLFTFGTSARADDPSQLDPFLQVWDLVAHDDVERRARVINDRSARSIDDRRARGLNPSAEAEFLAFEELESDVLNEPPPRPAARFADLAPVEVGGEVGLLEYALPPADLAQGTEEDLAGSVRWYVLPERLVAREEDWQALFERGSEELELKLTGAQYSVARAPGPILLSGSAGSGKTTIAVHRLAAATCADTPASALYVTYSRWLLDHARRLFADLAASRGRTPGSAPRFLTVEDLYRSLVTARGQVAPERIVGWAHFAPWLKGAASSIDPVLAWEEIRSIVKGACLDPKQSLLSRAEYEAKGRKRAPLFSSERGRLHDVALKWQAHLGAIGACDEIDLCRLALRSLRPESQADHVLCDEAQDLAEIQVELLLRLCRGRRFEGLYLAGDPQQVVNPSGFRWAEVRSALRERLQPQGRPAPALSVLSRNFRSVRGIVDLANEVLSFARERTGRSEGDDFEEAVVTGAAPVLALGSEADTLRAIADFGPRAGIVTGSEAERDRLVSLLGTTRVFTVAEAKGLEFDVAIAWGVVAADAKPWKRLLDPTESLREDPACRRALHHLYVAVTRARRHLAIREPDGAPPLWTQPRFASRLDAAPPDTLSRLLVRASSPEDWLAEGDWFRERGRHRQAAECYRRGGDAGREALSLAEHHEAVGDDATAARLFESLGEAARAAACAERAGDHAAAARLWERAGDRERARRSRIQSLEGARDWKAAAEEWEALGEALEAARCFGNAGLRTRQLRCLALASEHAGRPAEAAARWEEAGDLERAASAFRLAGRATDALRLDAERLESVGHLDEAARAWTELGDDAHAARCHARHAEATGLFGEAAQLHEGLGDLAAAQRCYRRGGYQAEARRCEAELDIMAGRFAKAAELLEEGQELAAAALAWEHAAEIGQAPRRAQALPLPPAATRAWVKGVAAARLARPRKEAPTGRPVMTGRPVLAGRRRIAARPAADDPRMSAATRSLACRVSDAEAGGRFAEAAEAWRALREPKQALRCEVAGLDASGDVAGAARKLESAGLLDPAAERFAAAGLTADSARCAARAAEKGRRWRQAAELHAAAGHLRDAARCRALACEDLRDFDGAALAWDEAGESASAEGNRVRAALEKQDFDEALRLAVRTGSKDVVEVVQRARAEARKASRTRRPAATGRLAAPAEAAEVEAAVASVLESIRAIPAQSCRELAARLGLRSDVVQAAVRGLTQRGALRKIGLGPGTRYLPR